MSGENVVGYCPMGCGQTLMLGTGGHVTCGHLPCPDPCAVDSILTERETEHIVNFDRSGFTVWHPLRERVGAALLDCALHNDIASMAGPPVHPGKYRATRSGGRWTWTEVKP